MHAIQEWINNHLIEWGIISSSEYDRPAADHCRNGRHRLCLLLYFSEYVQTACEENPQPMGRLDR